MTKARDLSKLLSTSNGKIAGENLDVSFENITDTGTVGTKVASGTTAERGSTAGQLRFNSDTGLAEYYTGTAFKSIDAPPTVTSLDVTEVDSQAGGNQTIVISGSGFGSGATVTFVGNSGTDFNASTVTVDSDTQITAVAPKASFLNAQEPYGVKVTNISGLSATLASQINVDTSPSWNTASGTLATISDNATGTHATVSVTDADGDTIVYSETTSVLSGAGLTLNSTTGAISGDPTDVSGDTTKTFTLRATAGSKTTDRQFSIIIKPTFELPSAYQTFVNGRTSGTVYYVSSSQGSDSNNGTSKSTPFQTLAKCAETVSSNDTVVLAPETFVLTGNHYGVGDGYACISAYKGAGTTGINTFTEKTNVWFVGYPQKTIVLTKDVGTGLRDHPFAWLSSSSGALGIVMERELFGGSEGFADNYMVSLWKYGGSSSVVRADFQNCVLKNASQSPTLSGDSTNLGINSYSWYYNNENNKYSALRNCTIHNANGSWQSSYSGAGSALYINNVLLSGSYNSESQLDNDGAESGQSLNTTNWYSATQSATVADTNGKGVYSGTYSWQHASYPASAFSGNW